MTCSGVSGMYVCSYAHVHSMADQIIFQGFCAEWIFALLATGCFKTLHLRPVDGSTARMGYPGTFGSKRLTGADRPTDGSIRGQPMLQVTCRRMRFEASTG